MNNSTTVTVSVEVTAVTWAKPDGSWSIVRTELEREQPLRNSLPSWLIEQGRIAVVGNLGVVNKGDILDVTGTFEDSKYGRQLKAQVAERSVKATDRAIQAFLRSFPQIGPQRAKSITEHFGGFQGVIDVLDTEPSRLAEIDGISSDRAANIADAYVRAVGRRDALLFTAELSLPQRLAAKVIDQFSGRAREAITADPYVLMDIRGVQFKDADQVAKSYFKVADDDPRRTAAAAQHVLDAATNDGHVFSTLDHLVGPTASRLLTLCAFRRPLS